MTTILERLQLHATHKPQQTAFTFSGSISESINYADLALQVNRTAYHLHKRYTPGERIVLLYPSCIEFVVSFLACLKAGLTAIPLAIPSNSRSKLSANLLALELILQNTTPQLILTDKTTHNLLLSSNNKKFHQQLRDTLPPDTLKQPLMLTSIDTATLTQYNNQPQDSNQSQIPSEIAFLQFSSGSTGQPKGVIITHSNIEANITSIWRSYQHIETCVNWLPMHHDFGMMNCLLTPLYYGITSVVIQPIDFLLSPFLWLSLVSKHTNVSTGGPNFAFALCTRKITPQQQLQLDFHSLQRAFIGAEKNHPDTVTAFHEKFQHQGLRKEVFCPCYGLAEATVAVAAKHVRTERNLTITSFNQQKLQHNIVEEVTDHHTPSQTLISVGDAIPNHHVIIVDPDTLEPCAENQVGEIWFSGPSVSPGYWNNTSQTALSFVQHPKDPKTRYLRTGDLGFFYKSQLYIVGRIKDLIIHRGHNIAAADIEWVVQHANPSLRQGCVCAYSTEVQGEEKLTLLAECRRNQAGNIDAIIADTQHTIGQHFSIHIHTICLLPEGALLKTSSGKIRRKANRAAYDNNQFTPLVIKTHQSAVQRPAPQQLLNQYFINTTLPEQS